MSIVERTISKLRAGGPPQEAAVSIAGATTDPVQTALASPAVEGDWLRFTEQLKQPPVSFQDDVLRNASLLPARDQMEAIADQFRRVKWPLLEEAIGRGATRGPSSKLIMVTSSVPGEGKTFCSINLAMSMARERDVSVVLVDGDIRKADITHVVGAQAELGLSNLISSENLALSDVVRRTTRDRLYFLPAGGFADNLPELCASRRMNQVLRELSSLGPRTLVILDTAPLLLTNETQVISKEVGQVVFVVKADATEHSVATSAIELLDAAPIVSCVLNQSSDAAKDYYRYGRYGYGRSAEGKADNESKK